MDSDACCGRVGYTTWNIFVMMLQEYVWKPVLKDMKAGDIGTHT